MNDDFLVRVYLSESMHESVNADKFFVDFVGTACGTHAMPQNVAASVTITRSKGPQVYAPELRIRFPATKPRRPTRKIPTMDMNPESTLTASVLGASSAKLAVVSVSSMYRRY